MKESRVSFQAVLAVLALITALPSLAQVFTASLSGLVTDPTGAGVPNASVKVRNVETNDVRQTQTASDGRYTISQLKPGPYEVTVESSGKVPEITQVNNRVPL